MSRHALHIWLIHQFPDAQIEKGDDIRVNHTDGSQWAFIYLDEKMPLNMWYEHQDQYTFAGVRPIWILDADLYLRYSKSKSAQGARLRNHIPKAIFSETGFCYYLAKRTRRLTIDVSFKTKEIWIEKNGHLFPHLYDFHDPFHQDCDLEDAFFVSGVIACKRSETRILNKLMK
ncbi:hypothetical protein BTO30_01540 [Domibacillus antri]|uniref:Uncharacterized protein n=1 Tax=Domibacillus antri TaxID=1714264 RepID=A0A1Q8QA03_9BACI|nr:hypothetical protein [Domibacillus antri]OLN24122.1 hypothetical protein BTO30_01540 [Domibacillus antri]